MIESFSSDQKPISSYCFAMLPLTNPITLPSAGDLGADVGAETGLARGKVEAGGAVEAVAIEQGDGREVEVGSRVDQVLGRGASFKEGEGRASAELNVGRIGHGFALCSPILTGIGAGVKFEKVSNCAGVAASWLGVGPSSIG